MRLKKHEPLNLSMAPLEAPADNDLDLPAPDVQPIELATSDPLTPPPATAETEPQSPKTPVVVDPAPKPQPAAKAPAPAAAKGGWIIYAVAALASVLWAALAVFAVGYQGPIGTVEFKPFQLAVFAILILAPIGFVWVLAYGVRQGARLAAEVRRAKALADEMLQPAATAAAESGSVIEDVRVQIEAATQAAAEARTELLSLREALADETRQLTEAAAQSARTAQTLHETLGHERTEMGALSARLDEQATAVADAVTSQAKMVAQASDLAQVTIEEAQAGLAARAADLAAAAAEASDASRIASEDLARQTVRLEAAGVAVSDQVSAVEDVLGQQRAGLVHAAHGLRADHEEFSVRLESQRAQVQEMLTEARGAVGDLTEVAAESTGAVREAAATTRQSFEELTDTVRNERDLIAAAALQSIGAVSEAARYEREQLESGVRDGVAAMAEAAADAHKLAAAQSETARLKIEQLSEAAFDAGQKSETAYQARIADAQALIARSADLVDEAASASAARLERALEDARQTFAELDKVIADFEVRASRLPNEAQAHAEQLKAAIGQGFEGLMESARRASEETQAIDAAFQERVRRNYEMLSEAVRLMGVVGGTAGAAAQRTLAAPRPAETRPAEPPLAVRPAAPQAQPAPVPPAQSDPSAANLRLRLKLAPTTADEEISQVFEVRPAAPAQAAEPERQDGLSWQDLLGSMDDAPVEDDQLADRIIGEVEALGADLSALLPAQRVEEIAAVLEAGDVAGARLVVKRLAPAAVRRLSRRILAERPLRGHADRYIKRYETALNEALRAGKGGPGFAGLLNTDGGRAFLLFDAAIGDLP